MRRLHTFAIVTALIAIAALPRLHDLGFLSFYGDEQLTAMVSRSVVEGNGFRMPSGMPYLRAVPLSAMTAVASEILGEEHEYAYRLPAAIFGILTVPLLFLLAQPYLGRDTALVASTLLALADWHIVTSREARMYAPFLFFFIATAFAAWHWVRSPSRRFLSLGLTLLAFCAAVAFHQLGILAVMMLVLPLAFAGSTRIGPAILLSITGTCWIAAQYYNRLVSGNFKRWAAENGVADRVRNVEEPMALWQLGPASWVGGALGLGLGLWLASAARVDEDVPGASLRRLARYALAGLTGGLAGAGLLHGAMLAGLVLLIIHPAGGLAIFRSAPVAVFGIALLSLIQLGLALLRFGLVAGLKSVGHFPFPYLAQLTLLFPGVMILFVGSSLALALRAHRPGEDFARACVLASVVPAAAIGTVMPWGEIRYLIEAFPFILLTASVGLIGLFRWSMGTRVGGRTILILALAVAASGLLGGHGIPQAWQQATAVHGSPQIYRNPYFFPDHEAPGEFVKKRRRPDDIVVTENALRQHWYVGPIDYWLRSPAGVPEVFRAHDGTTRDAYLNLVIPETAVLRGLREAERRVWFISSAEHWDDYFSPEQAAWLEEIRALHEPVFVGRDGVTQVYCIHCEPLE